jgi:hypothetical protein
MHRSLAKRQPERDDVFLVTTEPNHPVVVTLVIRALAVLDVAGEAVLAPETLPRGDCLSKFL